MTMAVSEVRDGPEPSESTPLLPEAKKNARSADQHVILSAGSVNAKSVVFRILVCAFMVSLSFGVTQVP